MVDEVWLEAAAAVAAESDAELRLEAAEVYAAEAARTRLLDLTGLLRVGVRSGEVVVGRRTHEDPIDEHLLLASGETGRREGRTLVVPLHAVITIDGSAVELRDEATVPAPRSIGSWLRDRWVDGDVLRILDRSGTVHVGLLAMVAADHVRLDSGRCIAFRAVDTWRC